MQTSQGSAYTQEQMAAHVGVSRAHYNRWLQGKTLSSQSAAALDRQVAEWLRAQQPAPAATTTDDAEVFTAAASSTPVAANPETAVDGDTCMSDAPVSAVGDAASSAPAPAPGFGVASTGASVDVRVSLPAASGACHRGPNIASQLRPSFRSYSPVCTCQERRRLAMRWSMLCPLKAR